MNALAGLVALVLVLTGSALVMKTPGATPTTESLEPTQIAEDMPAYIHTDLDEWR